MPASKERNQGRRLQMTSHRLVILTCLYFEIILNLSLWRFVLTNLEVNSSASLLFAASLPVFIFIGLYLIFNILLWPHIYKPVLVTFVILSSAANYVMYQYGIFIDSDMMRNVFETNQREALDYINPSGLMWLAVTGVLPSVLIVKSQVLFQPIWRELRNRCIATLVCFVVLSLMAVTLYKEYAVFGRNNRQVTRLINPVNYIYGTWRYFQRQALVNREFVRIDEGVRHAPFEDDHITVFVVVVGETARAMNFSLNGYERVTNPLLAKQDIISYQDVTASGTATAISLPAMFSHLPRSKFNLNDAVYSENIIDLLSNAGYEVVWLENDNGCKKVCDRVFTRDMVAENNPKYCDGTYCFDEVMIEHLEKTLREVEKDTVIVLHTIGSHGPSYYKRYPDDFKTFTPTCDTSEVQSCPTESIVNTYDNTIVYTDYVLNRVIDVLQKHPQFEAGMLYVSDHGESLGENGLYLHGLPFSIAPDEQIKVPMILWMSEVMKTEDHLDYECLRRKAAESYSHDNLFHSLAGLLEVDTRMYDADLDIFTPCRLKPLPQLSNDQN
ncbi:phosphoethanolamine--lipid A transferase [Deltaproteobacteria bacterium OttesenSCG-928-K17]|nr:phosphoethanolamine--lipid A transferase [Deltaproteobacteria bacterium OttesenSCG-928-K17]